MTSTVHVRGAVLALALLGSLEFSSSFAQGDPELAELLDKLGERAAVHERLLYEFHCTETLTRRLFLLDQGRYKEREGRIYVERFGIVVTHGPDGAAGIVRQKLDVDGELVRNRRGLPKETYLGGPFKPVEDAVPQAAVAWFVPGRRGALRFERIDVDCSGPQEVGVEFLDREGPRRSRTKDCTGVASGRICLDSRTGEVSRIEFYGLYETDQGCAWDRDRSFVIVEQELLDPRSGLRFPSRVQTYYPTERRLRHDGIREVALIIQEFDQCVFPDVRVNTGR